MIGNSVVGIKRSIEILLPLMIIVTAPPRGQRSIHLFYSSNGFFYSYIICTYDFMHKLERRQNRDTSSVNDILNFFIFWSFIFYPLSKEWLLKDYKWKQQGIWCDLWWAKWGEHNCNWRLRTAKISLRLCCTNERLLDILQCCSKLR